jgi:hypothetical protein
MKTAIGIALAFALALSVVPAGAYDSFHALSTLPAVEQASLTPLPDDQLATVEGGQLTIGDVCLICANIAEIAQANVNTSAASVVYQRNSARVRQEIN